MSIITTARTPRKHVVRRTKPLGLILWQGPSEFTGDPVALIATGFRRPSRNDKTGPMIQTWILRRDIHPIQAINKCAQTEAGTRGPQTYTNKRLIVDTSSIYTG